MAYSDIYTAATDDTHVLRKQIAVALHKAAQDVINESTETANHGNRLVWARKVTQGDSAPIVEAERWVWSVLENATIQAAPTEAADNDVQFVVNALVNVMANRG